jgi:hypothetical protein
MNQTMGAFDGFPPEIMFQKNIFSLENRNILNPVEEYSRVYQESQTKVCYNYTILHTVVCVLLNIL